MDSVQIGQVLAAIAVVGVTVFLYRWGRVFFALQKLPHPKGNIVLGNMMDLLRPNHHRYVRQWARELGGMFAARVLTQQVVVLADARLINMLYGNTENLDKYLEPISDVLLSQKRGHHTMFSSATNSSYWRLIRKGTAPAFITKNIRNGFPDIMAISQRITDCLLAAGPRADIDMNNIFMRYAMDVTGLVAFAKDFNVTGSVDDQKTDELFEVLRTAMMELYTRASNPFREYSLWNPEVRKGLRAIRVFKKAMRALVKEVKARGPPSSNDVSVCGHLMRLRDPRTGEPLDEDLLAGEFSLFFSAGIESAGNALTWTTYLISQHPEVEAQLVAELDSAGLLVTRERPQPRKMEFADLGKLTYLSWVCKEAMRLMPVASMGTSRITKRDMVIDGYFIPARSVLLAPFDAVHHHPMNWEDPDDFIPERWAQPGAEFLPNESSTLAPSSGSQPLESPLFRGSSLASSASRQNSLQTSSSISQQRLSRGSTDPALLRMPSYMNNSAEASDVEGVKRFLPFSTGPRQCLGQSLGRMMHDAAIADLYSRFHLVLAERMGGPEGVEAAETNRLTLQPGSGLYFNCISRGVKIVDSPAAPGTPDIIDSPGR